DLIAVGLVVVVVVLAVASCGAGRYWLDPVTVVRVLTGQTSGLSASTAAVAHAVVVQVRLPRILGALLVGAALASSGAAYQTMMRNPLVSPEILGVAGGAAFGGSLAILLGLPQAALQILAFVFGLFAAVAALAISRLVGGGSSVVLVLAGVVVQAIFSALISAAQYFANPVDTLPEITFWLFGSLARVTLGGLVVPAAIVAVCLAALYAVRWPLTVLAAGEDEARTLGVNRNLVWGVVIGASTLMTATVVSIAGVVGWVGLVIPHLARSVAGPSFARLLALSVLIGAGFLVLVDDVARTATSLDLPLGVLTALVGGPFFVLLLARSRRQWV
ncbi:MAG: iron ABC transporter permease, partial [Nocardiopsaceae bacterium]|nr:iron ABC transporter permease [Nocardiopsaceae bacterium]